MKPGQIIKTHREKLQMTQLDLSRALGYKIPQFVSLMENGHSNIPLKLVYKLSVALKINPDVLEIALTKEYRAGVKAELAKYIK